MRCRGMTLGKMPMLVWLYLTMAGLVLLAVSPLSAAQIMLLVDRYLGGHFFDTQAGGSAVIWMHFFWIFGHPEVYVLAIPAFAFASEIIPVFSRKAIFGYPVMVAAALAIGFIAMSVWAHHMFTVGMTSNANTFFVLSTMAIAVPTGIKIFNWLATMWGGKLHFKTPMLFCIAFLFQFLIAGLTGVMLSSAPFDWQLGNSYFVVAHFHYVIVGGILFTLFWGLLLLVPEDVGQNVQRDARQTAFRALRHWIPSDFRCDACSRPARNAPPNLYVRTRTRLGPLQSHRDDRRVLQAAGILVFVANLLWSYFRGEPAGSDPWDAWTLEWSTPSPPPAYNFPVLPVVKSRPPVVGSQAPGRSRLEVRVKETHMSAEPLEIPEAEARWDLPDRARVGMFSLIGAEAALFTIFVVAYLFYMGKSLTGPQPKDVLRVPIFFTFCLLSSSLTIHSAVRSLRRRHVGTFLLLWVLTAALAATFLVGTFVSGIG
jgi:cytochrome c oxidase subunit 1